MNLQSATDRRGAGAHVDKALVAGASRFGPIEADSVVADSHRHGPISSLDVDVAPGRLGVARDVAEGFTGD
jgi:hypothetical protein